MSIIRLKTNALVSAIVATILVWSVYVSTAGADEASIQPDTSWVNLTGTVVETRPSYFKLDYGDGRIRVEMDDWDWYKEGQNLRENDYVRVFGRVDNDLYETETIEAESVYVASLGTYFYANAVDEEEWIPYGVGNSTGSGITLTGTITSVTGRHFTLDIGPKKITVDTRGMSYNPMDDDGFQQLQKGDHVSVSGKITINVFRKRELEADTVTSLVQDRRGT